MPQRSGVLGREYGEDGTGLRHVLDQARLKLYPPVEEPPTLLPRSKVGSRNKRPWAMSLPIDQCPLPTQSCPVVTRPPAYRHKGSGLLRARPAGMGWGRVPPQLNRWWKPGACVAWYKDEECLVGDRQSPVPQQNLPETACPGAGPTDHQHCLTPQWGVWTPRAGPRPQDSCSPIGAPSKAGPGSSGRQSLQGLCLCVRV